MDKDTETNWKERCMSLEISLQKFREQVSKIRETLGGKMKELEIKRSEAEGRAEAAEQKLHLMEQQLAAIHWQPGDLETRIQELEKLCNEKDQVIKMMECQLEEQEKCHKLQRQLDSKLVEEKAAKIKEWVTNKLQQLENQNKELQTENEMLQDQVDILRERLQALPAFAAKEIYRISFQEDYSRTSSMIEESHRTSQEVGSISESEITNLSQLLGSRPVSETSSRPYSTSFGSRPVSEVIGMVRPLSVSAWSEPVAEVIQTTQEQIERPLSADYATSQPTSDYAGSGPASRRSSKSPSLVSEEPPEIPRRPSSSVLEAFKMEQDDDLENCKSENLSETPPSECAQSSTGGVTDNVSENESDDSMVDIENVPLYQEVDQNHESTYEPKKYFPPQIKIERKVFHDPHLLDSLISSSNGSEEILSNSKVKVVDNGNEILSMEEKPQETLVEERDTVEEVTHKPPPTQLTPFLPTLPSESVSRAYHHSSNSVSAIATLPRVRPREPQREGRIQIMYTTRQVPNYLSRDSKPPPVLEPQVIGPSGEMLPSNHSPHISQRAPWDKRTYAVSRKTRDPAHIASSPSAPEPSSAVAKLFSDVDVPVYATLKGKAAQIRSTPFTDDDSESSDNDDEGTTDQSDLRNKENHPVSVKSTAKDAGKKQQQSSSGATKRGVSSHSLDSEISCDYADPPDENSSKSDSESSEPEQKLLRYATDSQKHDTLEKFGYLSKLGGKVKMWKRRWFVLRNGELYYYKSQHDVLRKPQGSVKLDDQTRIVHIKGELTFEISNSKKTYYFNADSAAETEKWIRMLQKVLKRHATSFLLDHLDTKAVCRGWLIKVKHGVTRKCWCVLLGRYFLYYKNKTDKTPFGQIHLRNAKIEDVDNSNDSDDECEVTMTTKHVIAMWPSYQGPTYIMLPSKHEKDSWLYHLTVAAGGGTGNVGSEYEQLIAKVMEVDGDPHSVYWKHPMMLHCKDSLSKPLTTLPSEDLQEKAVEISKQIYQFMYTLVESSQLEFHVNLAQGILHSCVQYPELQNELYCQLIKQLSRHPVTQKTAVQNLLLCGKHSWYLCHTTPTSPTSSVMDLTDSKLNPTGSVFIQGWQLLSMCVSLFLPKQSIMWHLKVHLQRNADPRNDIGKYAIFCQRALERTIQRGNRESKPSRMEVMSILLRHPYHHSQPISIPVHFHNNTYQVISFDGSTTVEEFVHAINRTMSMRDSRHSGFALFSDNPGKQELEHCLLPHIKVCDVISQWENAYRDYHSGKLDSSRTIRLFYKNRLYFKSSSSSETEKEKMFLAYQVNEEIVNSKFPLNKDLALELASLLAQVEHGDIRTPSESSSQSGRSSSPYHSNIAQQVSSVLDRFYPKKYADVSEEEQRSVIVKLIERWTSLRGRTSADCIRVYLAVVRKWPFCGAKLFLTKVKTSTNPDDDVWLAVQEDGISVLEYSTMQPMSLYDYRSVITFGGWKDDFMVVVTQLIESAPHHYEHRTEKLVFTMPKSKILEITLLIASYINVKVQRPSQEASPDI